MELAKRLHAIDADDVAKAAADLYDRVVGENPEAASREYAQWAAQFPALAEAAKEVTALIAARGATPEQADAIGTGMILGYMALASAAERELD